MQSMQHRMESKIFDGMGFTKLAEKYKEHADEELGWVDKMLERMIDLGATPALENPVSLLPICSNIVDYLKMEQQVSVAGIDELRKDTVNAGDDYKTYDIFKAYLIDEEDDLSWTETQLQLIECVGLQNWLTKQM